MKHVKTYEAFFGLFKKKDDDIVEAIINRLKDTDITGVIKKFRYFSYYLDNDLIEVKGEWYFNPINPHAFTCTLYINNEIMKTSLANKVYDILEKAYNKPSENRRIENRNKLKDKYVKPTDEPKQLEPKTNVPNRIASLQQKLSNQ